MNTFSKITFLFIFLSVGTVNLKAQNNGGEPIEIKPPIGGTGQGGQKSPINKVLPLTVFFNDSDYVLEFVAEEESSFSFAVYSSNHVLIEQEYLTLSEDDTYYIHLPVDLPDTYILQIIWDGVIYIGTFSY